MADIDANPRGDAHLQQNLTAEKRNRRWPLIYGITLAIAASLTLYWLIASGILAIVSAL